MQVPKGGIDIQEEPVYWSLPDGRVVYWSLQQLRLKKTDEFFELNTHEAYREIAKVLGQLAGHKSLDVPTVGGGRLHAFDSARQPDTTVAAKLSATLTSSCSAPTLGRWKRSVGMS